MSEKKKKKKDDDINDLYFDTLVDSDDVEEKKPTKEKKSREPPKTKRRSRKDVLAKLDKMVQKEAPEKTKRRKEPPSVKKTKKEDPKPSKKSKLSSKNKRKTESKTPKTEKSKTPTKVNKVEGKLWRWYRKHNRAVDAVVDIACDLIPGGRVIAHGLQEAVEYVEKGKKTDKDKIIEMQKCLVDMQRKMKNLVGDIENIDGFKDVTSIDAAREIIEKKASVNEAVYKMLPDICHSMSNSLSKISKKKPQVFAERYDMIRKIGRGGQGKVYEARHMTADITVAIKLLPKVLGKDSNVMNALREEYKRVIQRLTHPNIVQYRDFGQDKSKRIFLVLDYIPGKNLRQVMIERKNEPMAFDEVLAMLEPVLNALHFAHQQNVVHCDLKPENILVRKPDGALMLTDFGLAREIRSTLSRHKAPNKENVSGTLPYMAPEQYLGKNPDARTDLWALGVIIYEFTAGHHPFQGTSFEHYMKLVCEVEPSQCDKIQKDQWKMLKKMLSKKREDRPDSLQELLIYCKSISDKFSKGGAAIPTTEFQLDFKPPSLSRSLFMGSLGFILTCTIVAVLIAFMSVWQKYTGVWGSYAFLGLIFVLVGGFCLSRLVSEYISLFRFYGIFSLGFLLFGAGWFGSNYLFSGLRGELLGSLSATVLLAITFSWGFKVLHHLPILILLLFATACAGYFGGGSIYNFVGGKEGIVLWGAIYGLVFGLILGYILYLASFQLAKNAKR